MQHNLPQNSEFEYTYNSYGNVQSATLPPNELGERMSLFYQYDTLVHLYPTQIQNSLGYSSTATYDLRFGKPTKTTDINGNEMWYRYDFMGRLKEIVAPMEIENHIPYTIRMEYHPKNYGKIILPTHSSTQSYATTYHYDPAGNLTLHINNLNDSIRYHYHYNLLTDILFSKNPAYNVHYTYGDTAAAAINAVGKIILQEDASGWQKFFYGKMGEVTQNIRTFALPNESTPYTFVMNFEYDSWNRIQTITYPDGEKVNYGLYGYDGARYTFSAKEKDAETGYSYFGSRYYHSDLSIWLSIDPMSDKYPNKSHYVYCSNNPIKIIDPNGEDEWQININEGKLEKIGNKGGNKTDYYTIGMLDEKGVFQELSNCVINREGKCNINSFRIQESTNSTLSVFHILAEKEIEKGFILERNGPDTQESGQKRRIPAGTYGLIKNYIKNSKYPENPRLYKESEKNGNYFGPFSERGILVHKGNIYTDSIGCLLPGQSYNKKDGDYKVSDSGSLVERIINICKKYGWQNMRINIINAIE